MYQVREPSNFNNYKLNNENYINTLKIKLHNRPEISSNMRFSARIRQVMQESAKKT